MEEIATVYARSLFEAALDQDKVDEIREQLGEFTDALDGDRRLQVFFFSPYFSTQEKEEGLSRAVVDADPRLVNFVRVLIENHRLPLIHRIRRQFEVLWDHENRRLPVEVTSAVELDRSVIEALEARILEQTGQNVELASIVDPDILGGIVLRVGNSILDASVRHRLDQLRKEVARAA